MSQNIIIHKERDSNRIYNFQSRNLENGNKRDRVEEE